MSESRISREEAISLGLKRYFTGKPCKNGHIGKRNVINSQCVQCVSKYNSQWYRDNPKVSSIKNKKWRQENKLKVAEICNNWRKNNQERTKKHYRDYKVRLRKSNPELFAIRSVLLGLLNRLKTKKTDKTSSILGYSASELKNHLENLFLPGMSWENWGSWHIDHIKPISAFIKEDIIDPSIINALSNLQPLWASDNIRKKDKYDV